MQIARSFKIAFSPRTAANWCLGIFLLMAVVQFVLTDPVPAPIAVASIIGFLFWFFCPETSWGVMCSLAFGRNLEAQPRCLKPVINFFMGGEQEKLPLFTMTLLGTLFIIAGIPFMFIQLIWYISDGALPGVQ